MLVCITNIFSWEQNNPLFVIHWPSYNRSLVRRGEILFSYDFLDIWDDYLERMNENKKGKKYKFPDSFILIIGHIRVYFHLPYRQTYRRNHQSNCVGKSIPEYKRPAPSYSQICRRINKLDIDINSRVQMMMMMSLLSQQRTVQESRSQTEVSVDAR